MTNGKFLVRVDDYPRIPMDLDAFTTFNSIMHDYDISYLLGITPMMSASPLDNTEKRIRGLTKNEIKVLKKLRGVSFALHGTTHQTLEKNYRSEYVGLSEEETETSVIKGLKKLREIGINTQIIIPPFNTFNLVNIQAFRKFFKVVTGGPETIKIFGRIPEGNLDGIYYLPSYRPFYGSTSDITHAVSFYKREEIKCITIHWAWDIKTGFNNTEKLAKTIEGDVIKWKNLTI